MIRLVCYKCGFKTNAVAENYVRVLCAGCYKNPQATRIKEGSWLREEIEAASRDHENLPDWLKADDSRIGKVSSYADL